MGGIIPIGETSFTEIKKSVNEYLSQNSDMYGIVDSYEGSVRTMLVDLLAGFGSYLQYKFMMYRNESFMSTVQGKSSLLELAVNRYGYNFNRASSPEIEVLHIGQDVHNLCTGDVVGTVPVGADTFDLVYMGETKKVAPMETFKVSFGIKKELSGSFIDFDMSSPIEMSFSSDSYLIDSTSMFLEVNGSPVTITRDPELYIIKNYALDVSVYHNAFKLSIYDPASKFGYEVSPTDTYKLIYIETLGRMHNIQSYMRKVSMAEHFVFQSVLMDGEDGDTFHKIKTLAPMYYSTFRVMSNALSHRVIAMSYIGVIDVFIEKSKTECCEIDFYYLYSGSGKTNRVLTLYEKEKFVEYLSYYKFMGVTLTTANIKEVDVINVPLMFEVIYECSLIPQGYDITSEIEESVKNTLAEYTLQLGKTVSIDEVVLLISDISINGKKIIKSVRVYENIGTDTDPDYQPVLINKTYSAGEKEYVWIDSKLEIYCRKD